MRTSPTSTYSNLYFNIYILQPLPTSEHHPIFGCVARAHSVAFTLIQKFPPIPPNSVEVGGNCRVLRVCKVMSLMLAKSSISC